MSVKSEPESAHTHHSNPLEALAETRRKRDEEATAEMKEAAAALREQIAQEEEVIKVLIEKQEVRLQRRSVEMARLEEMRKAEEQRRKEEEAEKKRLKDEEKERKRAEKARKQKEKEERAKSMGKKNFVIKKAEKSSLDQYNTANEEAEAMTKSREQLEEEKRHALESRIEPLDMSGLDTEALIAKAKALHDKLYKLESDKYDLEDRFKRQQYDMMELAERARQMNKGTGSKSVKIEEEPIGPCPFDRLSGKYSNAPPRVVVASKYERNLDRRNFFEKMGCFEKEWLGEDMDSEHDGYDMEMES